MDKLPDELLLHILSYVSQRDLLRLTRVSHQWTRVCYDQHLWRKINFYVGFQDFSPLSILRHLAKRIDGSQVVCLYCDRPLSFQGVQGLDVITNHFYNIRHLVLNQGIKSAVRRNLWTFQSLTTLALVGCTDLGDNEAETIAACSPQLRMIELAGFFNKRFTERGVVSFAKHCPSLEDVCITTSSRSRPLIEWKIRKLFFPLAEQCAKLKNVELNRVDVLSDESITSFLRTNPGLDGRLFSGLTQITEARFLEAEIDGYWHNRLGHFHVFHVYRISELGLPYYSCIWRKFAQDNDGSVVDVGLRGITNAVNHLTSLRIDKTNYITDHSLMLVAKESHRLQFLGLHKCGRITHKGILAILKHCLLLSEVTVTRCESVGRGMGPSLVDAVEDEMPVNPGEGVVNLTVKDCDNWGDDCMRVISLLCPSLERLYLEDTMMTDAAIADITKHCLLLQTVLLLQCDNLTDITLDHFSEYSRRLVHIKIDRCMNMTIAAVERFREKNSACDVAFV